MSSLIETILEHHGVKGMKWGVRRKATVGAQEVIVRDSRIGKGVRTTGGAGHPIHPDVVRARTIGQVGKKSGYKALSDKELQDYTRRLNLEQQAKRLAFADASPPKKFVLSVLGQSGKTAVQSAANDVATAQVKKHLVKKIGMAAAAAA